MPQAAVSCDKASKMEMIFADHRDRIPTNVLLLSHARSENELEPTRLLGLFRE
jgi:hypothetical protein